MCSASWCRCLTCHRFNPTKTVKGLFISKKQLDAITWFGNRGRPQIAAAPLVGALVSFASIAVQGVVKPPLSILSLALELPGEFSTTITVCYETRGYSSARTYACWFANVHFDLSFLLSVLSMRALVVLSKAAVTVRKLAYEIASILLSKL